MNDIQELEAIQDEMVNGRPLPGARRDSDFQVNEVVRNDKDVVTLYDRRNGIPSRVKVYEGNKTLEKMLAKRDSATESPHYGKKVFTSFSPTDKPEMFYDIAVPGEVPCMLHRNHPRFEEMRKLGFTECKRLCKSPMDADNHAKVAHQNAYPTVKEMDEKAEKAEERSEMREILKAITMMNKPEPKAK